MYSIGLIRDLVLIETEISHEQFISSSRRRRFVNARWAFCYLAREEGYSLGEIGNAMHRDHTTALHALRAVETCKGHADPTSRQIWHLIETVGAAMKGGMTLSPIDPSAITMEVGWDAL